MLYSFDIYAGSLLMVSPLWNGFCFSGAETGLAKADKASINNEMISAARRITALEMKELNERQRAEHAHKMYEHMRNSLRQVEERNSELESKFVEVRDEGKHYSFSFFFMACISDVPVNMAKW